MTTTTLPVTSTPIPNPLGAALTEAAVNAGTGTVYLLHFDRPYAHAKHYTGWTTNLDNRLAAHEAGRGARLLAVVAAHGIGWQLARTWPGDRTRERCLKNQGGASRHCPLCDPRTRTVRSRRYRKAVAA